jgi:hypothetical protein
MGSDGKIVWTSQDRLYRVNLTEKLLVPILSKMSNFIPEAGIWLNTQRPEWNDANNALVGYGVSMVTLYYLRRHLVFCRNLFKTTGVESIPISSEVMEWYQTLFGRLEEHRELLRGPISDGDRKTVLDHLAEAASAYRIKIYAQGFSADRCAIRPGHLVQFCEMLLQYIDHSIRANRRRDHLYHAYNLIKVVNQNSIAIRHLYEMLEGQVAVLSSGFLPAEETIQLLRALRRSNLYRRDQNSYILYPDRQLPRFISKNSIPKTVFKRSVLLKTLIRSGDKTIVKKDVQGGIHFNGTFRNAQDLNRALDKITQDNLRSLVGKEREQILKIFEELFDHQSFTGRSGTFYKYEGLGCIYWHMVSKLLLAVQESYYRALQSEAYKAFLSALGGFYHDIRCGLGMVKSPELYGGFPTDPYSHTPGHTGAQQPGMTGQVKEDIISRFGELGLEIHDGAITFHPGLLRREEFLTGSGTFTFYDVDNKKVTIDLHSGCLAFTLAQVPVVYHLSNSEKTVVCREGNKTKTMAGLTLDENICTSIFNRKGEIRRLDVFLKMRQ